MTTAARVGPPPVGGGPAPYLPATQIKVLRLLAEGATCRQIARELGVSEVTVRGYSHRIRAALDATTLAHAVHRAHQLGMLDDLPKENRRQVPKAEVQVLRLLAAGYSNSVIAALLHRPEYTVADQVRRLRQRLGARDRGHAVALGMAAGLVRPEDVQGTSSLPPFVHVQ